KDKKKNTWKEGDEVKKCMDCHNEPTIKGEKKLPEDKKKLNLKLSMHTNCQGCHKKLKKKDKKKYKKIPTTCKKCHTKKWKKK
ncbi:MAG: cytochrome c3 family protein, partial [Syntrophobacteria bacterium]